MTAILIYILKYIYYIVNINMIGIRFTYIFFALADEDFLPQRRKRRKKVFISQRFSIESVLDR